MQIDLLLLKRMLLAIVVFMGITLPSQGQIRKLPKLAY